MLLLLFFAATGLAHAQPQLQSNTRLATAGYFQLSWQNGQSGPFELQQARQANFGDAHTIYQGQDKASVISGLADGHYHYRLREHGDAGWSEPVTVEVKHHALPRAFSFFALGALMFIATVAVLIKGSRSQS